MNNQPDTRCTYTNNLAKRAIWVMANAPVNETATGTGHQYTLRMTGRMADTDP